MKEFPRNDAEFPSPEFRRIAERVRGVSEAPVTVHVIEGGAEEDAVWSEGGCEACRYVGALAWGRQACRNSRLKAAAASLKRGKTVPFLCHMGFTCASVPLMGSRDSGQVLTVGPVKTSEKHSALAADSRTGLIALHDEPNEELPFSFDDIPLVSMDSLLHAADWALESAALLERLEEAVLEDEEGAESSIESEARRKPVQAFVDPYLARSIVAAVAGGESREARRMVEGMLSEAARGKSSEEGPLWGRAVSLAAVCIESAELSGLETAKARETFAALIDEESAASTAKSLASTIMKVLKGIDVGAGHAARMQRFEMLNQLVEDKLVDGLTLESAAASIGMSPTALGHDLRRRFRLSFTEYLGARRVEKSKELLRSSSRSVVDVARSVGISDASNFSRLFRRHVGTSPTVYRARFGAEGLRAKSPPRKSRSRPRRKP